MSLIELEHLVDALKGFVRPLREGREAVKNLISVCIKEKKDSFVKIEALCLRTTKMHEDPVKIQVEILKKDSKVEEKIKSISCSCSAGVSKEHCCKHAMATLIYLEKYDEDQLEVLTCTAIEQNKRIVLEVTKDMEEGFRALLISNEPKSKAAVFLSEGKESEEKLKNIPASEKKPDLANLIRETIEKSHFLLNKIAAMTADLYSKCTPDEKEYYDKNIKITIEEAENIYLNTEGQDNELWKNSRFGRITGSICYQLFTYSKNKNPNWKKKLDSVFKSTFVGNDDTNRGLMSEADARECYSRNKENVDVVVPGILINPLVPWLGFSADGITYTEKKPVCLWECKTPKAGLNNNSEKIKTLVSCMDKKEIGKLKKRHPYYGQVQLGMMLYSLPICDFTLYCCGSEEVFIDSVMFDEQFCLNMVEALTDVYFKHVLPYLCSCC